MKILKLEVEEKMNHGWFEKLKSRESMDEVERKSVMLDVLYEDKDVLVVVKPAGIESQTSRRLEPDMVSEIKNYLHRKAQEAKKLSTGLSPKASTVTVEP